MVHNFENIKDSADLERRLRDFTSFSDSQIYDFGLMTNLLAACLDNLKANAVTGELEDITNRLDPEQKSFLNNLAELAHLPEEDKFSNDAPYEELAQVGAE